MSELKEIFESLCPEVERELNPMLSSLLVGPFIRGYLPQAWVFQTEKETVTFSVDRKGKAAVKEGAVAEPDVTIDIDHGFLVEALKTRAKPTKPPKRNNIRFLSTKGETAFNFLKNRFGL